MTAADLVVCRAGASVLGELPAAGKPAVLVPYPHAGAHQWQNARYLQEQGAAVVVEDSELDDLLGPTVTRLLADTAKLVEMAKQSRSLARPRAATDMAEALMELAKGC